MRHECRHPRFSSSGDPAEFVECEPVERIENLRAVDGDGGDRTVTRELKVFEHRRFHYSGNG